MHLSSYTSRREAWPTNNYFNFRDGRRISRWVFHLDSRPGKYPFDRTRAVRVVAGEPELSNTWLPGRVDVRYHLQVVTLQRPSNPSSKFLTDLSTFKLLYFGMFYHTIFALILLNIDQMRKKLKLI